MKEFGSGRIFLGVGGGIRYVTPVGPFRFDVGYNPDRHRFEVAAPLHIAGGAESVYEDDRRAVTTLHVMDAQRADVQEPGSDFFGGGDHWLRSIRLGFARPTIVAPLS